MIRIRNIDGGTWKNVNRNEAIEYACKYVFKGEERNLRRLVSLNLNTLIRNF